MDPRALSQGVEIGGAPFIHIERPPCPGPMDAGGRCGGRHRRSVFSGRPVQLLECLGGTLGTTWGKSLSSTRATTGL